MAAVQTGRVGELLVVVHPDARQLARAAADEAAEAIRQAVSRRGIANAMFATGNSQLDFVEALVGETDNVPWEAVRVFHMDEYVGIGPSHPAGFQRWIRERIVDPTDPAGASYLDGMSDPWAEAKRYAELLRTHPLDLCCLGIGENGHLAFNDPPVADFDDPLDVKVVELDEPCRNQQVGEGHFATFDDVPTHAVTVTVPALLRAKRVLAIVPEARKAQAVATALNGPIATSCPASALRRCAAATLHVEPDSASMLTWDGA